jgi:hypothetical protein
MSRRLPHHRTTLAIIQGLFNRNSNQFKFVSNSIENYSNLEIGLDYFKPLNYGNNSEIK